MQDQAYIAQSDDDMMQQLSIQLAKTCNVDDNNLGFTLPKVNSDFLDSLLPQFRTIPPVLSENIFSLDDFIKDLIKGNYNF
jgi:hypothetical protein